MAVVRFRSIPARAVAWLLPGTRPGISVEHPSLRGDRAVIRPCIDGMTGASPPLRGSKSVSGGFASVSRSIPARAGNSVRANSWSVTNPEHPRLREDQIEAGALSWPGNGSSPLVRGPVRRKPDAVLRHRNIPACAGTRFAGCPPAPRALEHPRLRGGPAASLRRSLKVARFIPACAGTGPGPC